MKTKKLKITFLVSSFASLLIVCSCSKLQGQTQDAAAEGGAPPAARIVPGADPGLFTVDKPEQFPLATATAQPATSELVVTGTVTIDVTRSVPVVSLASGRVVAIHARLGDTVKQGQLLMTVRSDDVSGGYSNYRKALADDALTETQLRRAKDLYEHGAIALNDYQIAQDVAAKSKVDVETIPINRLSWWTPSLRHREWSPMNK
jgi:cobalt-zinc-cadmium efflux system membrane fusion protein